MPTIEMMSTDYEGTLGVRASRVFNLEASVGVRSPNRTGDVMLIQAMLHVINKNHGSPYFLDVRTLKHARLPIPSGRIDQGTLDGIRLFQDTCKKRLLAVDGRIDPASFAGRKLRLSAEKKTTLQFLNEMLDVQSNVYGKEDDHTIWLVNEYPQLKPYVHDITSSAGA